MAPALHWEYKTIPVPSMDDWLLHEQSLALQAAIGEGHGEVIAKHAAFLNETLGTLGHEGWELVSIWKSDPSQLFRYTAHLMTFKRLVT